ncbi:MAG: hypothetical protein HY774_12710 [Acidobacteria bacterium]|nr:hypothetical protein [Acidobacteriota bacterium]
MGRFEEKGFWWLPEFPDKPVAGTLRFLDSDGGQLDILGSLNITTNSDSVIWKHKDWNRIPIILGRSTTGKEYTLVRCLETNSSFGSGYSTTTYQTNLIIERWHFQSLDKIGFDEIKLSYSGLTEWYGQSGILAKKEAGRFKFIEVESLSPVVVPIDGGELRFDLNLIHEQNRPLGFPTHVGFSQEAVIEIQFQEFNSLKKCLEREREVADFLTLAMGGPPSLISFTGINKDCRITTMHMDQPLPLLLHRQLPDLEKLSTRKFTHEMVFTFGDIEADPQSVVKGWFQACREIRPVIALYIDVLYRSSRLVRHQFQDLLAALCGWYFVRVVQAGKQPENNLKTMVELMIEPGLLGVLASFEHIVGTTFGTHQEFSQRVVSAKYGLDSGKYPPLTDQPDWIELAILTEQLKALVELCLLREIRFSEESQKQWFESIAAKIPKREQFAGWEF